MPDLIARYDDACDLAVIGVIDGVPLVFHDGDVRDARTVRIGRAGLTEILHAPVYVPAAPCTYYEYDYEAGGGADVVRESHPVVAWRFERGRGSAVTLNGNGIVEADEETTGNHRFVGYRVGQPTSPNSPEDK